MLKLLEWERLAFGARAASSMLRDVFKIEISKAPLDPLKRGDFTKISRQLAVELRAATAGTELDAMKSALGHLDVDWSTLSAEAQAQVIKAASAEIAKVAAKVMPSIHRTFSLTADAIVPGSKESAIAKYDLNIAASMSSTDERISKHLVENQSHYVRDEYGKRSEAFSLKARGIVTHGLEQGYGRNDLAAALRAELGTEMRPGYWNMIAMVFANRARTYAQLSSFEEAGITSYQWESVLDEVTSVQCRFLHGRTFPVQHAIGLFNQVSAAEDPEAVKSITPFVQQGKDDAGNSILYYRAGNGPERTSIARVVQSGMGQKDHTGEFSSAMANEALAAAGICAPPAHGHCRSTVIPVMGETSVSMPLGPTALPAPILPPPPKKPTLAQVKQTALDNLELLPKIEGYEVQVQPPFIVDTETDFWDKFEYEKIEQAFVDHGVSKKPKLDSIISMAGGVNHDEVQALIKNPKKLDAAVAAVKVAQWKGKLYIVNGTETMAAQKLLGQKVAYAKFVNFDKVVIAPPSHLAPLPVQVPHVPPPPTHAPLTADTILGSKVGAAQGSNDGGFYLGKDGVKRYVKFYGDASQASTEHLANKLYDDLGIGSARSAVFEHEGKIAYASEVIDGVQTVGSMGLNDKTAKIFMRGFVGDVLTGNWDAVGQTLDNIVVTPLGQLVRIDNGGTFLMRAKAGRKAEHFLNTITEWEKFFDPINPSYSKVAKAAGISSVEDFKEQVANQIKDVLKLRDLDGGGWAAYVDHAAPLLKGSDRAAVIKMLEERTKLLEAKLPELLRQAAPIKPFEPGAKSTFDFHTPDGRKLQDALKRLSNDSTAHNKFFSKVYRDSGLGEGDLQRMKSDVASWTGEYKDGSAHKRIYGDTKYAMFPKKDHDETEGGKVLRRTLPTREERWRRALDQMGLEHVPTPTHLRTYRGVSGEEFVLDAAKVWADDDATHLQMKSYETASWTLSKSKAHEFAGQHYLYDTTTHELNPGGKISHSSGMVVKWDTPMAHTTHDQVVDDSSFISQFFTEHEVIAGTGNRKSGPKVLKEDLIVYFEGRKYEYSNRADLIDVLKRRGHTL